MWIIDFVCTAVVQENLGYILYTLIFKNNKAKVGSSNISTEHARLYSDSFSSSNTNIYMCTFL